jgi:hypothetical protein
MKKLLLQLASALVLMSGLVLQAEPISTSTLPNAPIKATAVSRQHVFGVVDWSLAGSVVATHLIDFTSTETCISTLVCHEAILPNALVHSKPAFMAYELGTASLEILAQYELSRHGHRTIARIAQAVNISLTARTVEHNYQQASLPLSLHGLQPLHPAN